MVRAPAAHAAPHVVGDVFPVLKSLVVFQINDGSSICPGMWGMGRWALHGSIDGARNGAPGPGNVNAMPRAVHAQTCMLRPGEIRLLLGTIICWVQFGVHAAFGRTHCARSIHIIFGSSTMGLHKKATQRALVRDDLSEPAIRFSGTCILPTLLHGARVIHT